VARTARAVEGLGKLYGLVNLEKCYKGRSVFVTGQTGFKGSWLTEWLLLLGARVTGYSLPPPTEPALFTQLGLHDRIAHFEADIRQGDHLRRVLLAAKPDFVFHLAAQSLVRLSYLQPKETYDVNVMGTINVLEALRALDRPCAAVFVTTDKCYEQKELIDAYREGDSLGGHDPYSSSKAAAEIAIAAYRDCFFSSASSIVRFASARAGNVIGGGDWAADRIVPDCIRSLGAGEPILVRHPASIRPWQFVLDPLRGYLELAAKLFKARNNLHELAGAFNFGPQSSAPESVQELVEEILRHWPGEWRAGPTQDSRRESTRLKLSTSKALRVLGWFARYDFEMAVRETVRWYHEAASFAAADSEAFVNLTRQQICAYQAADAVFAKQQS
jgi:CDP-glucose 4,6-dehydratase